jgi:flagellar biosynthesis anti-sigma factor FlgM
MKIQNENIVQLNTQIQQTENKAQEAVAPQQASPQMLPEEKVTVSDEAVNLQQIGADAKVGDDVRMEMVNKIRAEIETGTYNRPSDQVATAMITTSLIDSLFQK